MLRLWLHSVDVLFGIAEWEPNKVFRARAK